MTKPPFEKILIANRGEIALRIIRTCRDMGIKTVAVYSRADENSVHVRFADEAVCIGPAPATQSYLYMPNILSAAHVTGADAIHPGYGFLAERSQFAQAVRSMGKVFIGPSVEHLKMFGDKLEAKEAARKANLPLLTGSVGAIESIEGAVDVANQTGYPVILKAAGGGGGKGMRVVEDETTLRRVFDLAQNESLAAFGSREVFIEKFLRKPRHVEVQVAGDGFGGGIHLGTRDCSLQRRHQKIIEEAPAPFLSDKLRGDICEAAANLIRSVGYQTVATCEFLVEGEGFYFLEVNPRIQVEHPVTEEVTGVDLIQEQIRLAAGLGLSLTQDQVVIKGHAIEVRVNAEDPYTFLPSPGRITGYHAPGGPGVRIDAFVHEQATVQPYYDSLTAKLIVKGATREQALARTLRAIDEYVVEGIRTTLPLQRELLQTPEFLEGTYWTRFVDEFVANRQVP